jgi:hypothetical protein
MLNGAAPAAGRILTAPGFVAVKGFRAILAIEYDGIHWRGFAPGGLWRGFFVCRVCPARVVVHGVMLQK